MELNAYVVQGDSIFTWDTSVYGDEGVVCLKASYRQSTFERDNDEYARSEGRLKDLSRDNRT